MKLDDYQDEALFYAINGVGSNSAYLALGLCGEAGEVAEKIKKAIRDGVPVDPHLLKLELGDVLWYVAVLAHAFDLSLDEVATENIRKLEDRALRKVISGSGDLR